MAGIAIVLLLAMGPDETGWQSQTPNGRTGQSVAGQSVAGQSVAGQSVAGQSVAGQSVAGQRGTPSAQLPGHGSEAFDGRVRRASAESVWGAADGVVRDAEQSVRSGVRDALNGIENTARDTLSNGLLTGPPSEDLRGRRNQRSGEAFRRASGSTPAAGQSNRDPGGSWRGLQDYVDLLPDDQQTTGASGSQRDRNVPGTRVRRADLVDPAPAPNRTAANAFDRQPLDERRDEPLSSRFNSVQATSGQRASGQRASGQRAGTSSSADLPQYAEANRGGGGDEQDEPRVAPEFARWLDQGLDGGEASATGSRSQWADDLLNADDYESDANNRESDYVRRGENSVDLLDESPPAPRNDRREPQLTAAEIATLRQERERRLADQIDRERRDAINREPLDRDDFSPAPEVPADFERRTQWSRQATLDSIGVSRDAAATRARINENGRDDVSRQVAQQKAYIPPFERETVMRQTVPLRRTGEERYDANSNAATALPRATGNDPDGANVGASSGLGGDFHASLNDRPWWPLLLTFVGLFSSIGFNIYLGWIAWDLYSRCQEAADDVSELEERLEAKSKQDVGFSLSGTGV